MKVATAPAPEMVGSYLDRAGVQHVVEVRSVEEQTWEIVDVPEQGDEVVVDRLSGEAESRETAAAVSEDYLSHTPNRAD